MAGPYDRVLEMVINALPSLSAAAFVLLAFWVVQRFTRPLMRRVLLRAGFDRTLIDMLVDGVYRWALIIAGLVSAASELGVNVGAALAGLGVAGIALGFAAQETVANLIAGFLIFWDHPFGIGDYITTQNRYGKVQEITMRTTRIRTMENTYVIIPNKQIIGDMLVNHSMYGEIRINVPIGIAYKEHIEMARAVLLPVLQAIKALDAAGIEIPFPHLQLFIDDVKQPALQGLASLRRATS